MIYIITTILFFIGVAFHCMQKIKILRDKFPVFTPKKIISTFLYQEWDTFCVSGLVWLVFQLGIFIVFWLKIKFPISIQPYFWLVFVLAVVLGYCGQRKIYQYLGTAEGALDKINTDLAHKYAGGAAPSTEDTNPVKPEVKNDQKN